MNTTPSPHDDQRSSHGWAAAIKRKHHERSEVADAALQSFVTDLIRLFEMPAVPQVATDREDAGSGRPA